jgi:hypothetical protein
LYRPPLEQLDIFRELLYGKKYGKDDEAFQAALEWLRNFPHSLKIIDKEMMRKLVCNSFDLSQEELDHEIAGIKPEDQIVGSRSAKVLDAELTSILPNKGFLRDYVEYTLHSEAPLAYHVFCALCGVGAIVNRRVWLNMGYYKLYPTLGILILGPSGIKKTSAANICIDLLQSVGLVKIYSEKLTPEALIEAMRGDNATGLVYAPEMTVFLNKQKYNEGLVQLITRFMDCPDIWESGTIGRGKSLVRNVAISSIMCSTLDWFIRSTPEDSFGGGFIARNLLIVQEESSRCEPIPDPGAPDIRDALIRRLSDMHAFEGEITLDKQSLTEYERWYREDHRLEVKQPEHELLATYYNRKPDHIKRVAICLHLIECGNLSICLECFTRALRLLTWAEQFLPAMLRQMFKSQVGEVHEQILRIITQSVKIPHSDLVRKMSYRMSAQEVKGIIQSLKESRQIQECMDNVGHYYTVLEES